jgi:hypothetical protein
MSDDLGPGTPISTPETARRIERPFEPQDLVAG